MQNFNPNWTYLHHGKPHFADGDFQGIEVEPSAINNHHWAIQFAARANPSYWDNQRLEEMCQHYQAALAKAEELA